ncbi:MAG TPA: MFS transporter [Kiloniellales bacterium]|nr:MFS transporter [Kiloniellales bacterium]
MSEIAAPSASGTWREVFGQGYRAPLAAISLGVGLYALNAFIVATALPSAVDDIGGVEIMSWSVSLFLVMAIVSGSAAALVKARWGSRSALSGAGALFLAGTLVAGFAPTMEVLLAGRALQGLGEGVIAALCYALIPALFPGRLVPKVFGVEAVVWAVAASGGPLLGGILTELLSWRWAVLISAPLSLLFVVLIRRTAQDDGTGSIARAFPGLRLLGAGGGILLVAVASLLQAAWAALAIAAALLILVATVWLDRRSALRLFPRDAFRFKSTVGAGLWVVLLMPLGQAGTMVYLAYLIQHVLDAGPTLAGLMNATLALAWSLVAILVADRAGFRWARFLIRLGPALLLLGFACHALAFELGSSWLVVLAQVILGSGFGSAWAFLSQAIMERAPADDRDRAAAMVPTVQSAGYAAGAALAGLVANLSGLKVDPAATVPWLMGFCALFAALAWAASFRVEPKAQA